MALALTTAGGCTPYWRLTASLALFIAAHPQSKTVEAMNGGPGFLRFVPAPPMDACTTNGGVGFIFFTDSSSKESSRC
ncbi:hypothetical protein E2562_025265 [Oryza meyeriana var. granulata]|uniref:Uncharacterized protein n=1 Tax=Oryza meyeriana var. granulata TaxID=110450 RepID=A0A6G1BZX7_9ORYZ|nr:hypothetical protein E2562_025265 [Oryza meyeriana var. granulata]